MVDTIIQEETDDINIKEIIDELKARDAVVKSMNEEIKEQKDRINFLENQLKYFLQEKGLESSSANGVKFSIVNKVSYSVDNWDTVWDWALRNGHTHLLYKKLKQSSLDELLDHGELPEFIGVSTYTELSRRKA